MTKDTQTNRLTPHDYHILAALAEGRIPGGNKANDKILPDTSVVFDQIVIDMDGLSRYRHKQAFSLRFEAPKWEKGGHVYVAGDALDVSLKFFDFTPEDFVQALEHIAEPATGMNRFRALVGRMIFDKMHVVKGYTVGPNSKAYVEHGGKLYPEYVGVYNMTSEALEAARQNKYTDAIVPLQQFAEHCNAIPRSQQFPSLEALCQRVNFKHEGGHTNIYDSICGTEAHIDAQRRILNPIFHYSTRWDEKSIVAGHVAIRAVLSSGEIATPEVIAKYIA